MQTPAQPQAPDPVVTANAQAQMNKDTAVAQYGLNATNQITPNGTLTYDQIGAWEDGTPRFQATTSLSDEQQGLHNQQNQLASSLNNLAIGQTDRISGVLNSPIDLSNEAVEGRLFDLGRKRLDPMFAQQRDALETQLMNRGAMPGSEAYDRAMTQFGQQQNDAYNNLALTGRAQSVQEGLTTRNQPINEISALMSGGQVSTPQFTSTPTAGIAPTDYIGAVNNKYMADLNSYNNGVRSNNAMMGGLFSLGSAALGGWGMGGLGGLF